MINEFYVFAGWQQDEIIGIVYREPANNGERISFEFKNNAEKSRKTFAKCGIVFFIQSLFRIQMTIFATMVSFFKTVCGACPRHMM